MAAGDRQAGLAFADVAVTAAVSCSGQEAGGALLGFLAWPGL
jgi:hypothetical protein